MVSFRDNKDRLRLTIYRYIQFKCSKEGPQTYSNNKWTCTVTEDEVKLVLFSGAVIKGQLKDLSTDMLVEIGEEIHLKSRKKQTNERSS